MGPPRSDSLSRRSAIAGTGSPRRRKDPLVLSGPPPRRSHSTPDAMPAPGASPTLLAAQIIPPFPDAPPPPAIYRSLTPD